ncbi:MAG: hypothetical protein WC389_16355 [Lutibacter sp.]|jgi:hypothetical protein
MRISQNKNLENKLIQIITTTHMPPQLRAKLILEIIENYGYHNDSDSDIVCPFCSEKDFDKVGLKYHLENYCEIFKDTLSIDEENQMRTIKNDLKDNK